MIIEIWNKPLEELWILLGSDDQNCLLKVLTRDQGKLDCSLHFGGKQAGFSKFRKEKEKLILHKMGWKLDTWLVEGGWIADVF